jgi:Glycosyltransferase family 87
VRTTLLNPTVWLLMAIAVTAITGAARRDTARQCLARVVGGATSWPILIALVLLSLGGMASRVVLGYLSPGVYAEEVISARRFLHERSLYGDARAELAQWLAESPAPADPFALPGVTPCQASAMATRPRFFTSQGHPPTLLLVSVPLVRVFGGRGLFVLLVLTSLAAIALVVAVFLKHAGLSWRSRSAVLLASVFVGWQPLLAGVRQGDAVVLAAALVVVAWHLAGRQDVRSGLLGGIAACLALPAAGVIPALLRCRWRSGGLALGVVGVCAGVAFAAGGVVIAADFASALAFSARTYAGALPNYAIVGRLVSGGIAPVLVLTAFVAALVLGLARARTADAAFGSAVMLGLLAMPIVWSQHLSLAIVPLAVLFSRVTRSGSAPALAGWALLALIMSLPDPAVVLVSEWLPFSSSSSRIVPVVSVVMGVVWLWLLCGRDVEGARQTSSPLLDVAPAVS